MTLTLRVELEFNESLVRFYEAYSRAFKQTLNESIKQVLADFAFGAIELGFPASPGPATGSPRPTKRT